MLSDRTMSLSSSTTAAPQLMTRIWSLKLLIPRMPWQFGLGLPRHLRRKKDQESRKTSRTTLTTRSLWWLRPRRDCQFFWGEIKSRQSSSTPGPGLRTLSSTGNYNIVKPSYHKVPADADILSIIAKRIILVNHFIEDGDTSLMIW